jgi:hypothetical protein
MILREGESIAFATVEPSVAVNHAGTIITKEPIIFGEEGYIEFDDDSSPNFLGDEMSIENFLNTDFSQDEDESLTMEACSYERKNHIQRRAPPNGRLRRLNPSGLRRQPRRVGGRHHDMLTEDGILLNGTGSTTAPPLSMTDQPASCFLQG